MLDFREMKGMERSVEMKKDLNFNQTHIGVGRSGRFQTCQLLKRVLFPKQIKFYLKIILKERPWSLKTRMVMDKMKKKTTQYGLPLRK